VSGQLNARATFTVGDRETNFNAFLVALNTTNFTFIKSIALGFRFFETVVFWITSKFISISLLPYFVMNYFHITI
jgi:hypothetical protein